MVTAGRRRGFRVTDVQPVDDGPWPEVEISFVAEPVGAAAHLPAASGSLRRPIEAEWRRLSFYDDPARYARALASAVEHAAQRLLSHPDGPPRRPLSSVPPDEAWRRLLSSLREYGEVRETGPGRIEVTTDDTVLTFLITPEQWAEIGPEVDDYPWGMDEVVGLQTDDELFFVFHDGGFACSVREELPPVRGTALERRIAAIRLADPDAVFTWSAHPGEPP